MAPMHWTPNSIFWEVLIEEMVFAFIVDQPIRIVEPLGRRSKMKLRAKDFIVYHCRVVRAVLIKVCFDNEALNELVYEQT